MDKEILKKILQIDSLTNVLDWRERVIIHFLIRDMIDYTTSNIIKLYDWIIKENWGCPERNYGHDRILYFYDPDSNQWLTVDYYLKINSEYEWILQLRNN